MASERVDHGRGGSSGRTDGRTGARSRTGRKPRQRAPRRSAPSTGGGQARRASRARGAGPAATTRAHARRNRGRGPDTRVGAAGVRQDDRGARLVREPRSHARLGDARQARQRSEPDVALRGDGRRSRPGRSRPPRPAAPPGPRGLARSGDRRADERDRVVRRGARHRARRPAHRDRSRLLRAPRLLHRAAAGSGAPRRDHAARSGAEDRAAPQSARSGGAPRGRARVHERRGTKPPRRPRGPRPRPASGRDALLAHRGMAGRARTRRDLASQRQRPRSRDSRVRR